MGRILEQVIATVLIASRWLMAPLYLGLIAALLVDGFEFFEELAHTIVGFGRLGTDGTILAVLKLVDLVLIANLILIMIVAGIGTLGTMKGTEDDAPLMQFMGKVDFSGLKLKVVAALRRWDGQPLPPRLKAAGPALCRCQAAARQIGVHARAARLTRT
jgi:uncharacterized protein (TIGR00645 family)